MVNLKYCGFISWIIVNRRLELRRGYLRHIETNHVRVDLHKLHTLEITELIRYFGNYFVVDTIVNLI